MILSEFSSNVVLTLLVGRMKLALSHVNSRDVILRDTSINFPPTEAELLVVVDGVAQHSKVFLPNGISEGEFRVSYF